MEGMMNMAFYEAGLAPPMWSIAVQATISTLNCSTSDACDIGWWHFEVKNEVQICLFMVQELLQVVVLALKFTKQRLQERLTKKYQCLSFLRHVEVFKVTGIGITVKGLQLQAFNR